MRGERYKSVQRGNSFTQRVVSVWNKLPEVVVEAGTILSFKKHLDSYMGKMGIEGYGSNAGNWDSLRGFLKKGRHGQVGPKGLFPCCKPL